MMSKERRHIFDNETTLKIVSPNLLRLSKTLAFIRQIFKNAIKNISGIRQNLDSGVYFVYVNIDDSKLDLILEQITPYTQEVKF